MIRRTTNWLRLGPIMRPLFIASVFLWGVLILYFLVEKMSQYVEQIRTIKTEICSFHITNECADKNDQFLEELHNLQWDHVNLDLKISLGNRNVQMTECKNGFIDIGAPEGWTVFPVPTSTRDCFPDYVGFPEADLKRLPASGDNGQAYHVQQRYRLTLGEVSEAASVYYRGFYQFQKSPAEN